MILPQGRFFVVCAGSFFLAALIVPAFIVIQHLRLNQTPVVSLAIIEEALEKEETAQAMLYCKKRISERPDDWASHLLLGECYERSGSLRKAVKIYERLAEKQKDAPAPYFYLGRAYYRQGDTEQAVDNLRIFKELASRHSAGDARNKNLASAHALLAKIYMESQEYRKAVSELVAWVELDPKNPEVRYELATAYAYSNQHQSAFREFQKIVDENPGSDIARYAENAIQYVRERRNPSKSRMVLVH